ncbi:MAG: hypothetical protein O2894_04120, partial [Planctomycetota bacterium]|nr:hypothetical protein [Planctomycetota bacterium]
MSRSPLLAAVLVLGLTLPGAPSYADEVHLRAGEIVVGEVTARTEETLTVVTAAGERVCQAADVLGVIDEATPRLGLPQRWAAARTKALRAGGATTTTEKAVTAALDWLAAHQDEDGKLDADDFMKHDAEGARCDGAGGGHHGERVPCGYDGVTTAVTLMAWLASGSTAVSGPYRDHVARALAYCRGVVAAGPGRGYGLWNHGFCTQAVADAQWMRATEEDARLLERAVAQILALQLGDGGWSYYMPIGDVPTTAVAAGALALCAQAGVEVQPSALAAAL